MFQPPAHSGSESQTKRLVNALHDACNDLERSTVAATMAGFQCGCGSMWVALYDLWKPRKYDIHK